MSQGLDGLHRAIHASLGQKSRLKRARANSTLRVRRDAACSTVRRGEVPRAGGLYLTATASVPGANIGRILVR
jgi:hypothetical protein